MRIELLDKDGNVVGTINNVLDTAEAQIHMPHYPGAISWREVDPAVVIAEIAAKREGRIARAAINAALIERFLDVENRLRALEAKPALSREQFIADAKARSGR